MSWLIGKDWCCEGLGAGGKGDNRGWNGWMVSPTQWMWVWVNSRSWWWTGRPGTLRFMGSQSQTRLSDWTELKSTTTVSNQWPNIETRNIFLALKQSVIKLCFKYWKYFFSIIKMWKQRHCLKYITFQEKYVYATAKEITCWSLMVVYTGHLLLTTLLKIWVLIIWKRCNPYFHIIHKMVESTTSKLI